LCQDWATHAYIYLDASCGKCTTLLPRIKLWDFLIWEKDAVFKGLMAGRTEGQLPCWPRVQGRCQERRSRALQ
jgi:hypothetical protein